MLHGKNAFMRAFLEADGPPVLGYTRSEVCGGAAPTLGDFLLTVDFINNQGLGGPLPDLIEMLTAPEPGQVFQGVLVNATAQGPLRFLPGVQPGTPGFMHVLQRGPTFAARVFPDMTISRLNWWTLSPAVNRVSSSRKKKAPSSTSMPPRDGRHFLCVTRRRDNCRNQMSEQVCQAFFNQLAFDVYLSSTGMAQK